MKLLSPILAEMMNGSMVQFFCPGCETMHVVPVNPIAAVKWYYNGNPDAPTLEPSLQIRTGHYVPGHEGDVCPCTSDPSDELSGLKCSVCHSFVTDGHIQFLPDCTHHLAGLTVPLPPIPAGDAG